MTRVEKFPNWFICNVIYAFKTAVNEVQQQFECLRINVTIFDFQFLRLQNRNCFFWAKVEKKSRKMSFSF